MDRPSTFRRLHDATARLPDAVRLRLLTAAFVSQVKYAATSGVSFRHVEPGRVTVHVAAGLRVQNHIGGLHAVAMAMAVESATGAVVGLGLPAVRLPLLRSLQLDYVARCEGGLTVEASLDAAQQQELATATRGDVEVAFTATDDEGGEPIRGAATWAWITPGA